MLLWKSKEMERWRHKKISALNSLDMELPLLPLIDMCLKTQRVVGTAHSHVLRWAEDPSMASDSRILLHLHTTTKTQTKYINHFVSYISTLKIKSTRFTVFTLNYCNIQFIVSWQDNIDHHHLLQLKNLVKTHVNVSVKQNLNYNF